jgi:hypothetical protein
MSIDPARDTQGMQAALRELLEESLEFARVKDSMETAAEATRESMLGSLPPRTLAAGYYTAAEHLFWLEARLKVGAALVLSFAEADGLVLLSRARGEFEHNHPPCYKCGKLQAGLFATSCPACGADFKKGN